MRRKGKRLIFRPWRRTKDGRILWAWKYGLKAWPIWVDDDRPDDD